jgi:hypothetical protein
MFPPLALAWTVWGLGALLYLIGFYQRVAPAVITDQLMLEFAIGGAALGNLSAFYFYSYVAMQIPTGMIADRWGPRRLLTVGAGVAALGTALFAFAPTIFLANMGRLLIGASVAVAFVSMLKLASHWFPPKKYAMVSGMALLDGRGRRRGGRRAAALPGRDLRLAAGDGGLGGGHRGAVRRDLAARARRSGRARLCQPFPGRAWRARRHFAVARPDGSAVLSQCLDPDRRADRLFRRGADLRRAVGRAVFAPGAWPRPEDRSGDHLDPAGVLGAGRADAGQLVRAHGHEESPCT